MRLKNKVKWFVVWDCNGLEYLVNASAYEKEYKKWDQHRMLATVAGDPIPPQPKTVPLQLLKIRARANMHRNYRMYLFATEGLTEDDVRTAFETDRNFITSFIEENGTRIH